MNFSAWIIQSYSGKSGPRDQTALYRLLKNRGARLLNMGLDKSQTHPYPAHTVNKCCMLLSVILFLYSYRPIVSGKMSYLASTCTFSSWICALHTSLLIIVVCMLRRPAGSLTRSAGTPYRLVPAHFYHWWQLTLLQAAYGQFAEKPTCSQSIQGWINSGTYSVTQNATNDWIYVIAPKCDFRKKLMSTNWAVFNKLVCR